MESPKQFGASDEQAKPVGSGPYIPDTAKTVVGSKYVYTKTTTGSLLVMRNWLVESGVTIAAMESTSTYWKPPFYCLEEMMEVWLLNAAHMKAVPGRKTDVRDAEWIAQLLEHGKNYLAAQHARLTKRGGWAGAR